MGRLFLTLGKFRSRKARTEKAESAESIVMASNTNVLRAEPVEVGAIRGVPLRLAESLAEIAARSEGIAITYTVVMFYGIPALFALLSR